MRPPRPPAPLALLFALAFIVACGDDGDGAATTAERTPSPSPSVAVTTPDPGASAANRSTPFDAEAAAAHVRALSDEIGSRPTGTEAERKAAEYLRDRYEDAGYRVELQTFTFSSLRDASIQVTERSVGGVLPLQGTSPGEATGALRFIGLGGPDDVGAGGLEGRIAVAHRGVITFGEKARNAERAGAIALIVINRTSEQFSGNLGGSARIPVVGVPGDAEALLRDASTAGVRVTVRIDDRTERRSQNVVARPPGGGCRVAVGGHYDSVSAGPGANDNASGAATVLAVAETRAARGQRDGVCYVAFGGEELGLHGSRHYVDSLSNSELDSLAGMLNLDMVGVGDEWKLIGSASMQQLGQEVARLAGIAAEPIEMPSGFDSDHTPFVRRDVPALFLHRLDDPNYHTASDRSELVQTDLLGEAGRIALGVLDQLLGGP